MIRSYIISAGFSEPFSALSHLIGAIIILMLMCFYFGAFKQSWKGQLALLILGISQSLAFLMSALYHALPESQIKFFFWHLDHVAVILCITGTASALLFVLFDSWKKILLLLIFYLVAIFSIASKWLFTFPISSYMHLCIGLGMGIAAFIYIKRYYKRDFYWYMFPGAFCSLLGGCIDGMMAERSVILISGVIENHEIMHLLVFAGNLCFFAMLIKSIKMRIAFYTLRDSMLDVQDSNANVAILDLKKLPFLQRMRMEHFYKKNLAAPIKHSIKKYSDLQKIAVIKPRPQKQSS